GELRKSPHGTPPCRQPGAGRPGGVRRCRSAAPAAALAAAGGAAVAPGDGQAAGEPRRGTVGTRPDGEAAAGRPADGGRAVAKRSSRRGGRHDSADYETDMAVVGDAGSDLSIDRARARGTLGGGSLLLRPLRRLGPPASRPYSDGRAARVSGSARAARRSGGPSGRPAPT